MSSNAAGAWVVAYADRSRLVVFDDELEALRFAHENRMDVCRWFQWGEDLP